MSDATFAEISRQVGASLGGLADDAALSKEWMRLVGDNVIAVKTKGPKDRESKRKLVAIYTGMYLEMCCRVNVVLPCCSISCLTKRQACVFECV